MNAIKNYIAKFSKKRLIILMAILVLTVAILIAAIFIPRFFKGPAETPEPSQKTKMQAELKELEELRAKALDNGTSSQEEMRQDLADMEQQRKETGASASSKEEMQKQLEELNKLRGQ